jgi:hypothetical protein
LAQKRRRKSNGAELDVFQDRAGRANAAIFEALVAETPQTITWHLNVKYLAFKNDQTGQEYWIQESRSGILSTPDSSGTSEFESNAAAWSCVWTIEYNAPNPVDYGVAPPPQNVFPA